MKLDTPPLKRLKTGAPLQLLGFNKDVWSRVLGYVAPWDFVAFSRACHAAHQLCLVSGRRLSRFPVACCPKLWGHPHTCTRLFREPLRYLLPEPLLDQAHATLLQLFPPQIKTACYLEGLLSYATFYRQSWETCHLCRRDCVTVLGVQVVPLRNQPSVMEPLGIGCLLYVRDKFIWPGRDKIQGNVHLEESGLMGFVSNHVYERDGEVMEPECSFALNWRVEHQYAKIYWVQTLYVRQCLLCCLCKEHLRQTKPFFVK